jgi:hypothetical protein
MNFLFNFLSFDRLAEDHFFNIKAENIIQMNSDQF